MTVRLTVQRAAWEAHMSAVAAAYGPGMVPVVKGNGYGFGRPLLHHLVHELAGGALGTPGSVCVGSVHELHDVPADLTPVVLTPTLEAPTDTRAVLTVGNLRHVEALRDWHGSVMVKLASSMHRHGATRDELPALLAAVNAAGLPAAAYALHLPLAGSDDARLAEIEAWLPLVPAGEPLWVSHLEPAAFHRLVLEHPDRTVRIRVGTALWHGRPRADFLHLDADVLHTRPVRAGEQAGYQLSTVPFDGTLVVIGAGSSHGVSLLDGLDLSAGSPFHFAHARVPLLERPHMHSTIAVVPDGQPCPAVGDRVDLQRPFITTAADEVCWR